MLRTVTVVLAATVVMAVTASGQDDDLAVAVEQTRQNVSELAETIRLQPENAQLWAHWFTQRTMLHHLEARLMGRELDAADATEAERQSKERLAAWFASWEEEFPANPALSLLRLQILEPVELQIPGLEALATRFPHHLPIAERLISAYTTRGERQRAIAAATEFLAHNPEQPQAYAMLHRHYLEMNDEENLDALIDAWLRHLPGDFDANVLWLQRQRPYLAPEEMPAVHRQITARLRGDERARWCAYLGQNDSSVAAAVDCFTVALPELDTEAPIFESSLTRYADALRRSGDESAFTQVFSRLPAERRVEIHQRMVQNLVRERHCAEAAALLAEVADPGRALAGTGAVLDRCLGDAAFRQRTVEAVAGAASQDVLGTLGQATPDWPVEGLEAALEQRRATAEEHFRWLDVLYEKSGQDGKRLALLERWHQDFPAADSARTRELAELYLLADRPEDAVRVLEEHLSHPDGARAFTLAEDLTAIYHHLGRNDAASELAQRLFAGDDEERGYGALLLARLAFAAQKLEKARDFYEIFYRETSVNHWRQAEDFQVLLLELDDRDALVRHLERQWQARLEVHQGDGRDRDEWVGDKLLELGLAEKALDLYRRRIVGGSAPAALLQKTAELAEGLGEWDQALAIREELLERSPSDPRAWGQLAEHFLVRGEVERAFAVLDEAFDRLPRPDAKLWHLWVSAVLSVERGSTRIPAPQLLEAIEVLRQAVEVFDARVYDRGLLYARLTRLYHHLGLQASEELAAGNAETAEASSEAPGTSSRDVTGIPSGEDKAAAADLLARADELNSGVAGLDREAARALYERAAASGDAVATVRLATLRHLGTCGFPREVEDADELARPHLEIVRQRAADGDGKAQYVYGTALLVGVGTEARPADAIDWLQRSASAGEPWAMFNLGWIYGSGTGVHADRATALAWYRRAAEAGHVDAMWNLAYRQIAPDRDDNGAALDWLHRAAEAGHVNAQRMLAEGYDTGRHGLEPDPQQARAWFERAAAQGDQTAVGWLHAHPADS